MTTSKRAKKFAALVVGVKRYLDSQLKDLECALNGAIEIAKVLEENKTLYGINCLGFEREQVLGDCPKSRAYLVYQDDLKKGLKKLFKTEQDPPDLALFYFCGHGGSDQNSEKYLFTSDSTEEEPRGILFRDLFDILKTSTVKNQVIWLDCCFSGELINDFEKNSNELEDEGINRFILASSRKSEESHAESGKPAKLTETILKLVKQGYTNYLSNEEIEDYIKKNQPKEQNFIIYNTSKKPPMAILRKSYRAILEELENPNPYPGFKSFDEKNAPFFFGRDELIEEMLQKIEGHSFIVLTGSSGTGKSSLLSAGVYDAIKQGQIIARSNSKWDYCIPFTPLEKGNELLAELQKDLEIFSGNKELNNTSSPDEFVNKASSLVAENSLKEKVIIIVDQFEQIFRQQNQNKDLYLDLIKRIIKEKNSKICIVVGIRSDFLSTLEEELKEDLNIKVRCVLDLDNHKMEREDIRNIITQPIECLEPEKINIIEKDLQNELIDEFVSKKRAINLPILQYILNFFWKSYDNKEIDKISLKFYQDICESKIKKSLSKLTEEIFNNKIPFRKQNIACRLVMELYYRNGENIKINELENDEQEEKILKEICEIFVEARLMTIGRDSENDLYCCLSHPLVAESWEKDWGELEAWIKDYPKQASETEHELERYAKKWQSDRKNTNSISNPIRKFIKKRQNDKNLISGKQLKKAQDHLKDYPFWKMMLDGETIDFIRRSQIKEEKNKNFLRIGSFFVIILIFIFPMLYNRNIRQQAKEAEQTSFILRGFDRTIDELRKAILIGKKVFHDSPSPGFLVPHPQFLDDIKKIKIVRNLRHSIAENNLDWFEETNIRLNGYDLPDGKWIEHIDTTTIDLNKNGKRTTYIAAAGYNSVNLVRILPNNKKELCTPLPHYTTRQLQRYQANYKNFVPWVNQVSLSTFNNGKNLLLITVGYNSIKITNLTEKIINDICNLQDKSEEDIYKAIENHTATETLDKYIDPKQKIINDEYLWINSVDVSNDKDLTDKIIATAGYDQVNLWKVTIKQDTPSIILLKNINIKDIGDETIPERDSKRWINQVVISSDEEKDNQIIAAGGYNKVSLLTRDGYYIGKLDHSCDKVTALFKFRHSHNCQSKPDTWVNSISIISKPNGNENIIATAISSYGIFLWSKSDKCLPLSLPKSNLNRNEDRCISAVLPYATWNPPKYVNIVKLFKDERNKDFIGLAAGGSDKMLRIWGIKIDNEQESQPIKRINLEQMIFHGNNINSVESFDNKHLAISSKSSLILKILKPQVLPFSTYSYEEPVEDLKFVELNNHKDKKFLFTKYMNSQKEKFLNLRSAEIIDSSKELKKINFEKTMKITNLSSFDLNGNTLVIETNTKNDGEYINDISTFELEFDKNKDINLEMKNEHTDLKNSINEYVSKLNEESKECKFSIESILFTSGNRLSKKSKLLFHIRGEKEIDEGKKVLKALCENDELIFWDLSKKQIEKIDLPGNARKINPTSSFTKVNSISSFPTNDDNKTFVIVVANEGKDIFALVSNNSENNENNFKEPIYLFNSSKDCQNEKKCQVKFIEFSPTGKRFATVETVITNEINKKNEKLENIVRLWGFDPESNPEDEQIKEVKLSLPITKEKEIIALEFGQKLKDKSYPLLIATTNQFDLWKFDEKGNKLRQLKQSKKFPRRINQAGFVPDKKLIAIANANIMTLWNFHFKLHDILTNTADIKKFVFSTDGEYVVSSTEDNQVTFWETGEKFINLYKFIEFGCRWIKSNLEINNNFIHTNSFEYPELPKEEIEYCNDLLDSKDKGEKN